MTPSLETLVKVLTAERDEYQKAAVRTAANCKFENDKLKTECDALKADAERWREFNAAIARGEDRS